MAGGEMSMAAITVRELRVEDAQQAGEAFFHAFWMENVATGVPPEIDIPTVEGAVFIIGKLATSPSARAVSVVENSTGKVVAGGFIHQGAPLATASPAHGVSLYSIGPVYVHPEIQNKGLGKAVMLALLDLAKSANVASVRLTQSAPNKRSFALYAGLGFVPVECITRFYGTLDPSQAQTAADSLGISTDGIECRAMEEADVKACAQLFFQAAGYDREADIINLLPESKSWIAIKHGKIVAYTTGLNIFGHSIATDEGAVIELWLAAAAAEGGEGNLLIPGRLYPRLLRWALAAKLLLARHSWYMVLGHYQPPADSFLWFPSVLQ